MRMRIPRARRLALSLTLLIVLGGTPARGQGPAPGPENPHPVPNGNRPPQTNGITSDPPAAVAVQADPAPGLLPYPGSALPMAPVELAPARPPQTDSDSWVPSPAADASFSDRGTMTSPFLNTVVGHAPFRVHYGVTWFTPQPVSGQPTDLGYERQDFSVSFPCWQNGACDEWLATVSVRNELFQTHALLPDTHQPFPESLWNIRVGTTYRHVFDNGWIAGGTVSIGSASDKPFHSIDEMTAGISAFLRVPRGEHDAWLFTLSYSPTGELPFPIPGVAYLWQPSENFRANIGLPLQVWWRPVEDLTFDLSYMLLTTVHARATYRVCRPLRLYAAYASENEGYFLADRPDSNFRFYNVDQRVTAGLVVNLSRNASVDLSSGYIFDHHFFEGKNITSGTNFNRLDIGAGPFIALQGQLRW